MKRFFITILLSLLVMTGLNARTFVLSTGVSEYNGLANNLNHTTQDTKRFAELMKSQTKDITILTGKNANKANILEKLRAISNRAQRGDRIIFFFSGHGARGSIAASDGLLSYDELINVLSKSAASEKVCFIDACYAGTMADVVTDSNWTSNVNGSNDMVFFVASRPDETSKENPKLGAGAFSQSLFKGLRGKADIDGNKKITIMELFKYIHGDVMKHTNSLQHPQLIGPKRLYDSVIYVWK